MKQGRWGSKDRGAPPKAGGHGPPGRIRIIAGTLRNSRLDVPHAAGLRPTPDRVRETLFNWLAPVIDGARCLDLFAGTGALGVEAASRGAREVVLVERDFALAKALEANLARLKVGVAKVENRDALAFLGTVPPRPFDIAFVDPPFDANLWRDACAALASRGWLAPDALVYVESPRDVVPEVPASWTPHREAHAGEVRYALYRCSPSPA